MLSREEMSTLSMISATEWFADCSRKVALLSYVVLDSIWEHLLKNMPFTKNAELGEFLVNGIRKAMIQCGL